MQTRSAILLHAHSTPSCDWSGLRRHDQTTVVVRDGPDAQTRDYSRADTQIQSLVCATSGLLYVQSEFWALQASHLQCLHIASKNCFRIYRPMRTPFQRFPAPCTRDSLLLLGSTTLSRRSSTLLSYLGLHVAGRLVLREVLDISFWIHEEECVAHASTDLLRK